MKKQAVIYSVGTIILKSINFLLIPLYISNFSLEDFGQLSYYQVMGMILSWVLGLKITDALVRFYYEYDDSNKLRIIQSAYWFSLIFNLLLGIILFLFFKLIFFNQSKDTTIYFVLYASQFILFFTKLNSSILRIEKKALKFIILQILQSILQLSFIIFFVVILKLGIISVFYGQIASGLIILIVYFVFLKRLKHLAFNFNFVIIKKFLNFSVYLIPSALSFWILNSSDHIFIKFMLGKEQLGIYAFAYKFSLIIALLLVQPLTKAWSPFAYSNLKDIPLVKNRLNFMITTFILMSVIFILPISYFIDYVLMLFAKPEYMGAIYLIFPLGIAYIAFGVSAFTGTGFHITKNTKVLPKYTTISAIVNILLNFILIKLFGIIGAAIATIVAFILKAILNINRLQKDFFVNYSYNLWLLLVLNASIFYFIGLLIEKTTFGSHIIFWAKIILFSVYLYSNWRLLLIDKNYEKAIVNEISKIFYKFVSIGYIYKLYDFDRLDSISLDAKYTLRRVNLEDAKELKEFSKYRLSNHYKKNILPRLKNPTSYTPLAVIDKENDKIVYLAWIVFSGNIKTFQYYYHRVKEGTAFLFDAFTIPEYRKKGLHKVVMQKRIELCLEKNIKNIQIAIARNNFKAIRSIKKTNFKKYSRIVIVKKIRKIWIKKYEK